MAQPIFSANEVLRDLNWLAGACEARCITDGETWAYEMINSIPEAWHEEYDGGSGSGNAHIDTVKSKTKAERVTTFGCSLIKSCDFYRAHFFLENVKNESHYHRFLYYWSMYLANEKKRLESEAESISYPDFDHHDFADLHSELCRIGEEKPEYFDAFLFYVLGKIRVSLKLTLGAKEAFIRSVTCNRAFWPAWEELVLLVDSAQEADTEEYTNGDHWMHRFFKANVLLRFSLYKNALEEYEKISESGFADMPYLVNQIAACFNLLQEHDNALKFFEKAHSKDPHNVEHMHLYSDSLYVRGLRSELASLAHEFYRTHKFRWETCCIVANYYSLRGDHERAVIFLQRSLKLNPYNTSAWTLIGHEFMEQKNNAAACLSYRKAVATDPKDYRGWYGLGQLYDILKMPSYSLYYYQRAYSCKPDDSRMLVALGEVYVRMRRFVDAQKCFLKAYKVGDVEGTALMLLGKLYDKRDDFDAAALAYEKYLDVYGEECMDDEDNVSTCCSFLARHYLKKNELSTASAFAQRCLEYEASKEDGRDVLRKISLVHHRLGTQNFDPPVGATSTPVVGTSEQGRSLRPDAQQLTPILPQVTISHSPQVFRPAPGPAAEGDAGMREGPPREERRGDVEGGEADMAISSDEDN